MQVYRSINAISLKASACAIGMFDGVHVGHVMVLENALREARLLGVPSAVVSFANHPQFLISQTPTELLSCLDERLTFFEQMGFDYALILDFDEWLKNLPAEDFIQQILVEKLGVKSVTVGYDHRFGKNRSGDGAMLKLAGQRYGFDVQIIDPVRLSTEPPEGAGQIVSSTLIRKLLAYGDIEQANRLLGRPYDLPGIVEEGLQRGRQLGFPTANLAIDPHRLIPANGTYGGYADLNGVRYQAVCNIGLCPTFGDQAQKRVEVHLLDYPGDAFYGQPLRMIFLHKIRDERKFPSVDALVQQIRQDCQSVQETLTLNSPTTQTDC
jgi:riboflavin kinase / FMN adenylyltransferase